MELLKKILGSFLALSIAAPYGAAIQINAVEQVDYTNKLNELKKLIEQCNQKGISTDYEMINCSVIEAFGVADFKERYGDNAGKTYKGYINADIANGREEDMVNYNISRMEELYCEAKENLTAYLKGTKTPYTVERTIMSDISSESGMLYDGKDKPFISIGYGHFDEASDNIPKYEQLGVNNNQIEIGPTTLNTKLEYVKSVLKNAEKYNVGINLLISPHYFPTDIEGEESLYVNDIDNYGPFIKYNINHTKAKEIIEDFLRELLPQIKDYKSLTSICLSNEPCFFTSEFKDFYNDEFRTYLKEVHNNSLTELSKAYGKSYLTWNSINIPNTGYTSNPIDYDWIMFNEKVFSDWHKWMAEIIREYLPNVPLHSKSLNRITTENNGRTMRYNLNRGTGVESFDEFSDWAGCDAHDYVDNASSYYETMFYYDYMSSVTGKPVYNSEDHIIADQNNEFSERQLQHWRNSLWMGAMHGRDMSTIWQWRRRNKSDDTSYNSLLFRPDIVAQTGKTDLDMMRLNGEIEKFQKTDSKVAIMYSKPTVLYNYKNYAQTLINTYAALLENGIRPGVISEESTDLLSKYNVLILPNLTNTTSKAKEKIENFLASGGKVLYSGEALGKNEYNQSVSNTVLKNKGYIYDVSDKNSMSKSISGYLKTFGMQDITLTDNSTGEAPTDVDWSYVVNDEKVLLNITNLDYNKSKDISVYYNGDKLADMTDLIGGEHNISEVTLESGTPQLLECSLGEDGISDLRCENSVLKWRYNKIGGGSAKIYKLNANGTTTLINTVIGKEYGVNSDGTYIVKDTKLQNKGEIISMFNSKPLELNVDNVSYSGNCLAAKASFKNTSNEYVNAVFSLNVLDSEKNVLKGANYKITVPPQGTDGFEISLSVQEANEIVLSATDVVAGNTHYGEMCEYKLN